MEKLNVPPFANYFHAFSQCVSTSPNLLIIGYGAGDDHINFWLREFTLIHSRNGRVVEITKEIDPSRFTIQRFGAYDLVWEEREPGLFINHAGIECVTWTGGLDAEMRIPMDVILSQFRRRG